jgi:hypothetical protein
MQRMRAKIISKWLLLIAVLFVFAGALLAGTERQGAATTALQQPLAEVDSSGCVQRFRVGLEFEQAQLRAERESYEKFSRLRRGETRLELQDRLAAQYLDDIRRQHGLTEAQVVEIIMERAKIYAVELATRYPPLSTGNR